MIVSIATSVPISFHQTFQLWRTSKGMSARQVSLAAGLSASYVSKMEAGGIMPPIDTFMRLVKILGCNDKEILFLLGLTYEV